MGRISDHLRQLVIDWPQDADRGAVARFCAEHGVSRSWFYQVRRLAQARGQAAALKDSRRPHSSPARTSDYLRQALLQTREQLKAEGKDYGPLSVLFLLEREGITGLPSRVTVARIFDHAQVVDRNKRKRPKRSYRRIISQFPNQRWQADAFDHQLATGEQVVVIEIIDDATRYSLGTAVAPTESSRSVVALFKDTITSYGRPVLIHTDNGTAFNQNRAGRRTALVSFLDDLGIKTITGKPVSPRSQGKVERSHQTIQNYLAARECSSAEELTEVLNGYRQWYNHERGHQALGRSTTPADLYETMPKVTPPGDPIHPGPAHTGPSEPRSSAAAMAHQAPIMATRTLSNGGRFGFGNQQISCGPRYAAQVLHLLGYPGRLEIYDTEGTYLISIDWPPQRAYPGIAKQLP